MALDKAAFTKKLGPLPIWAWGAIPAGSYVVYKYLHKSSAPVVDSGTAAIDTGDVGSADDFSNGLSNASGGFIANTSNGTSNVATQPAVTDNLTWGKEAQNYLVALGVSVTDAATAIASYLYGTGQTLNASQSAALAEAIKHLGTPPEGVIIPPPTTPVNPPAIKPVPLPVKPLPPKVYYQGYPTQPPASAVPSGTNGATGKPYKAGGKWGKGKDGHWYYVEPGTKF